MILLKIINKTFEDNNLKNGNTFLFFMYQDYISKTAAIGKKPTNSKYQVQHDGFFIQRK